MQRERKLVAPVAAQRSFYNSGPKVNRNKSIVVKHREYLTDITTTATFGTYQVDLNPGLTTAFPWLGTLGSLFEQYKFKSLKFVYRNRCGTNTNAQVLMATQYDSQDNAFASKQEMYEYAGCQSAVAWADAVHNCDLKRGAYMKKYFVRTGAIPSGTDVREYDVGQFNLAALSTTGGTFVGELLVEYEVELFNPKSNYLTMGYYQFLNSSAFTNTTNIMAGTMITVIDSFPLMYKPTTTTTSVLIPNPGLYTVMYCRSSNDGKNAGYSNVGSVTNGVLMSAFVTNDVTTVASNNNIAFFSVLTTAINGVMIFNAVAGQLSTSVTTYVQVSTLPLNAIQAVPTLTGFTTSEVERRKAIARYPQLAVELKTLPLKEVEQDEPEPGEPDFVRVLDRRENKELKQRSLSRDRILKP